MKFETLMLGSLFTTCLLVCVLILGAMLNTSPQAIQLAADTSVGNALLSAPATCALPDDGVICARSNG